jgi:hypothetical protein
MPALPTTFDLEPVMEIARHGDRALGTTFIRIYMRFLMIQDAELHFEEAEQHARDQIMVYANEHGTSDRLAVARVFSNHPMFHRP